MPQFDKPSEEFGLEGSAFFDAIDHLTIAVSKLDDLGITTVSRILSILK